MKYLAGVVATLTLAHQPEAVEALERRLRDEILTANLSKRPVTSADERFTVQRVLGHGASSVVCKAVENKLERPIALKLFPGLADDALARAVKREALALAKISHANIVTIHDFGVLKLLPGEHCCFFVAMELGVPLKDWLRETSPAPESVLATFCRIGEGLAAIHAAGFVYRDFKPENVVLVAGVPKIVDFGLALTGVTGSDGAGTRIVGTPAFMSPEALRGRPQDPRSDQFSFAAALWKSLSGELPYDGHSQDPAMRGPLRPPRATMPESVLPALRRALDPEPARRFPDMAELIAALLPKVEPGRSSSTTARTSALMLEVDSTTELVPVRRPARRSLAPWLALPAVGVLSVGGVLAAMGFWNDPEVATAGDARHDDVAVAVAPAQLPPPPSQLPPPPSPSPECPDVDALPRAWHFRTVAQWAEQTRHLGKVGKYTLDLSSDGTPCGLQVDLRKLGTSTDPEVRRDKQRVKLVPAPSFTGGFSGHFAPRRTGDTVADHTYDFDFIIHGERLYGDFHAEASAGKHRFSGTVEGVPMTVHESAMDGRLPCTALCGARCLGVDATTECRQTCSRDAWAEVQCPAPDPSAQVVLPPKSEFCASGEPYAGQWLFLARDRENHEARAYEVELTADKCDFTVKSARERDSGALLQGGLVRVYSTGLWQLTLTGGQGAKDRVSHEWSLVGRDPAFGEFTARHGKKQLAAGVIAAYRRP